jgi:hypothetical protein
VTDLMIAATASVTTICIHYTAVKVIAAWIAAQNSQTTIRRKQWYGEYWFLQFSFRENALFGVAMDHNDWPTYEKCEEARQFYGSTGVRFKVGGLDAEAKVKSVCMSVDDIPQEVLAPREGPALPPPLARMMPPWLQR